MHDTPQRHTRRALENNKENLCFINSIIQFILPCKPMLSLMGFSGKGDASRPFTMSFQQVIGEFYKSPNLSAPFSVLSVAPQFKTII